VRGGVKKVMKAIVDSREPTDVKSRFHATVTTGVTMTEELPQADFYLDEYDVAIERKEASDFASSTTDGRLSEQADRMVAEHEHVFVIIERSSEPLYDLPYTKVSDNSLIGMQTSLAVKRGVRIIYTESVEQTVYAVKRIFERFCDGEHERAGGGYVKTADTGEVDNLDVRMIAQIDGISADKARTIVEEVGDLNRISWNVSAERGDTQGIKDALMQVNGIGPTLAGRLINVFS